MSTDISREAAEAALQERVSHFQKFSHQNLARFCAELEQEKLQLDFEWQDEFSELQRATAALREDLNAICELFTDSKPENIRTVVGAYVRTIQGVKDRLLAENNALREENACFRAILKGEEYEELDGMVTEGQLFCLQLGQAVAKNTKKIMAERAELRAECERLRAQLNSANQQHQL